MKRQRMLSGKQDMPAARLIQGLAIKFSLSQAYGNRHIVGQYHKYGWQFVA